MSLWQIFALLFDQEPPQRISEKETQQKFTFAVAAERVEWPLNSPKFFTPDKVSLAHLEIDELLISLWEAMYPKISCILLVRQPFDSNNVHPCI